jgi:hypothetical protein
MITIGHSRQTLKLVISDNMVDINLGLNYVSVCCNLVNENFCVDANGKRSDIITTLGTLSKQDGNATTTAIHTMIFLISYKINE